MTQPQEHEGIRYELFNLQVCDAVAAVVAEAFAGYEPMMVSQNIPVNRMADYLRSLGQVLAQEELAVVALDIKTDRVVGALITRDFVDMLDMLSDEGEDPINAILNTLDRQYTRMKTIRRGQYLHLNLLAVAQQHTGRAVAPKCRPVVSRKRETKRLSHRSNRSDGPGVSVHLSGNPWLCGAV